MTRRGAKNGGGQGVSRSGYESVATTRAPTRGAPTGGGREFRRDLGGRLVWCADVEFGLAGAFDPDFAVAPVFLFPDGDDFFEALDGVAAGFEAAVVAVGGGDGDEYGGLFDFAAADAMEDADAFDEGPAFLDFGADAGHHFFGHGNVGFVDEEVGLAGAVAGGGGAAYCAGEGDDAAAVEAADAAEDVILREGLFGQFEEFGRHWIGSDHGDGGWKPPDTGGRRATSSPSWRTVSRWANSSFTAT